MSGYDPVQHARYLVAVNERAYVDPGALSLARALLLLAEENTAMMCVLREALSSLSGNEIRAMIESKKDAGSGHE